MYTHTEIATTSVNNKKLTNCNKQANKLSERAKEVSPAGRAKSTESEQREQNKSIQRMKMRCAWNNRTEKKCATTTQRWKREGEGERKPFTWKTHREREWERDGDKFFKKGLMKEREETCFGRNYLRSNLKTLNQFVFEFRTVYKLEHGGVNKKKLSKNIYWKDRKAQRKGYFLYESKYLNNVKLFIEN